MLVRVVSSSRPLLHLLKLWAVVSPYLVQVRQRQIGLSDKDGLTHL